MQIDPLKTRLGQLKKASIELKSKVLNEHKIDYQAVSDILNSILPQKYHDKHIKGSLHPNYNTSDSGARTPKQLSNHTLVNSSSNSLNYSPVSSIFVIPPASTPININKAAPEKIAVRQRSSSNDSMRSRDLVDVDIEKFKKQNEDLQMQMTGIAEELANLQRKERSMQEDEWKENLPFLHRKGAPGIFLTKLFIKEYDYDKIDYEEGKAEIIHDKLIIQLPTRPSRQYKLSALSQVKYVGDKCLKLDFKIDETLFVFLQFENAHEKDSWDLALFVNQKIITNKELEKSLFHEVKEREKQREREDFLSPNFSKGSKSKSSLRLDDDRVNQRSGDSRNLQYKSQKLRKSSVKVTERKTDKSYTSKGSSDNKHDQSSRFFNQLQYTLNGHHNDGQMNPNPRESFTMTSDNNDRDLKELMVFGEIGDSHNQSRAHTSKFNMPDVNYQNLQFVNPPSPSPAPQTPTISAHSTPLKSYQQQELRKWQGSSSRLKSGYYFTKYARDGIRPHNKHVSISQDEDSLMCVSTDNPNQKKQILIENIKKVRYPAIGEGIKKHIKNARMEHFCVIQYSTKGVDKVMELGCQKVKFIARFAGDLYEFLRKKGVFMHD